MKKEDKSLDLIHLLLTILLGLPRFFTSLCLSFFMCKPGLMILTSELLLGLKVPPVIHNAGQMENSPKTHLSKESASGVCSSSCQALFRTR